MSEIRKNCHGGYVIDGYIYHVDSGGQVYRETTAGDIHGQVNRIYVGSTLGRGHKVAVKKLHEVYLMQATKERNRE